MTRQRRSSGAVPGLVCALVCGVAVSAHDGPPYPIISNQIVGAYRISVWTDPDATDDGTAGGQFWVTIDPASEGGEVAADLRVRVSIRPLDRPGSSRTMQADPVDEDHSRQFAALLMDHEGPFAVHVDVDGASGPAALDARVEATYDLRPPRILLAVYLMPFLLVGFLWAKLLVRRRRATRLSDVNRE